MYVLQRLDNSILLRGKIYAAPEVQKYELTTVDLANKL